MAGHPLEQIRAAISQVNPHEVRRAAEQRIRVALVASGSGGLRAMEDFFAPPGISASRRSEISEILHPVTDSRNLDPYDLVIYEDGIPRPANGFRFLPQDPLRTVEAILERREQLGLPLARSFQAFRKPVVERVLQTISRENGLFALLTALPDVTPNLFALPLAAGQFASDTAFLTVNQVRMAFLIAAASDRPVGYREQKTEIASIIAGAFGWRALARELVGKVPFGAGLVPKAAIAYAGTYVVGLGLERYYRIGYGYTRAERRRLYRNALERGKSVMGAMRGQESVVR